MREYIYIVLFLVGLASNVWARVSFERRQKSAPQEKRYVSLYREHSTLMILIFLAVLVDNIVKLVS